MIGPIVSDPEVFFAPLQPPLPVHELALAELQLSVIVPPAATVAELDVSDAVAGGLFDPPPPPPPPQPLNSANKRSPAGVAIFCGRVTFPIS